MNLPLKFDEIPNLHKKLLFNKTVTLFLNLRYKKKEDTFSKLYTVL